MNAKTVLREDTLNAVRSFNVPLKASAADVPEGELDLHPRMCRNDSCLTPSGGDFGFDLAEGENAAKPAADTARPPLTARSRS
jgi:hypothetical protein